MSKVFEFADHAVTEIIKRDPCTATELGEVDPDGRLTDFSPAGIRDRRDNVQAILDDLETLPITSEVDDRTIAIMAERLGNLVDMADAGDYLNDINILASPPQAIRMSLELLPADIEQTTVIGRLAAIPEALAGWRESLALGAEQGIPAARRQALAVADQLQAMAEGWLPGFFESRLAGTNDQRSSEARDQAEQALRDCSTWLADVYSPQARTEDAVGADTYQRKARAWNGLDLDLTETYEWGWAELARISDELKEVGQEILPGATLNEVKVHLDNASEYQIRGTEALLAQLAELTETATADLNGTVITLPDAVRTCEVKLAAEGAAAAPYYVPPSEDLSRPGSTWYPTQGKDVFPRWWLTSVWYHESVPGHHLQFGVAATETESLSRFQRVFGATSAHAEGWALYAERLMDELGYFADLGLRFGYLSAQSLRAVRVVVDIGMHLGLRVPAGYANHDREVTPSLALKLIREEAMLDKDFASSEVDRYLGLPGQAISYKVGEREWLSLRSQAEQSPDFSLLSWHNQALALGPMGLAPFRKAMEDLYR